MVLAETVYNKDRTKLINRGTVLEEMLIDRLRRAGIDMVWISDEADEAVDGTRSKGIAENPQVSKATLLLYDEMTKTLREIRSKVLTAGSFDMYYFNKFIEKVLDHVMKDYRPFTEMVRVKKTKPSMAEHMADVCLLAAAAGKVMGLSAYDIRVLAAGAMLHDIGKFFIPDNILNKPVGFSEEEQYLVMKHTTMGHDLLAGIKGTNKLVLKIVVQHHERLDGSGYPYGLSGDTIDKFAAIVGLADMYAEQVCIQPDGKKYASYEVAEILGMQAGIKFYKEYVEAFLNGIVAYPLQSIVRLNTGEVAKVVYIYRELPTRPVVKVGSQQIDLSRTPTIFVEDFIQLENEDSLRY
jgi:HD-GYP domain-containing protein (c-di-GMP phosphodiesterase class II)